MNNNLVNNENIRISPSHRNLLKFVWKIHLCLRNNLDDSILKRLVLQYWQLEIKDHLVNEEIEFSQKFKKSNDLRNKFFQYHKQFKRKIKEILDTNTNNLKDNLESLCLLLIEMVRFEEKQLKSLKDKALQEQN